MPANSTNFQAFDAHTEAATSIRALQSHDSVLRRLPRVGHWHHTEEHAATSHDLGDRMQTWGRGAFWGGCWGLAIAAVLFATPAAGHPDLLGTRANWLADAMEGAVVVVGLGALGAVLYDLGSPQAKTAPDEAAIKANEFAIVQHGSTAEATQIEGTLATSQALAGVIHKPIDRPIQQILPLGAR